MSLWRGILQQRRDEWTSSLRGLDGIEEKPEIYNENIPAFRHNGAKLGFTKDLRTDEQAQKDFTPFQNKKSAEYLTQLRKAEWEGSNFVNDMLNREAEEAYQAQEEIDEVSVDWLGSGSGSESEDDLLSRYTGQTEDEEDFEGMSMEEIRDTYKARKLEALMIEFQSADSVEEQQRAYDELKEEVTKPGANQQSEEAFIAVWGKRPTK